MNPPAVNGALALLTEARTDWLIQALDVFSSHRFVDAVWVEGSLGRGDADAFSDVDLVLAIGGSAPPSVFADPVAGLGLPGRVLYTRDKPKNAPSGGAYRAACVELVGLPVLVDLYLWPAATASMSAAARLLFQRGDRPPRSDLSFLPLISQYLSGDTRDSDPYQPQTVLMLVQLAAKYLARGNHEWEASIRRQLRDPADASDAAALRRLLAARVDSMTGSSLEAAVTAVHRLIEIAEHQAAVAPKSTTSRSGLATTTAGTPPTGPGTTS
ncbi:nucleotidyltransferase domain-containing protein [Actinoplanes sp. DH11]|uniref:nucleotidyltransferase domain-containing protein n=1 Tax=Actinoplanes sp. DH11 TaxID=2857011 RepID=UPI001E2F1D56|nr:nucleotidyltransferase domain-containing protein [Actinoplanes sp. DH11]